MRSGRLKQFWLGVGATNLLASPLWVLQRLEGATHLKRIWLSMGMLQVDEDASEVFDVAVYKLLRAVEGLAVRRSEAAVVTLPGDIDLQEDEVAQGWRGGDGIVALMTEQHMSRNAEYAAAP